MNSVSALTPLRYLYSTWISPVRSEGQPGNSTGIQTQAGIKTFAVARMCDSTVSG